jgi:hypothetical protein
MEDHPIICRILMVPVISPITGLDMNLNIPTHQFSSDCNDCITEIRSPVIINPPRVDYFYWLPIFSAQANPIQ